MALPLRRLTLHFKRSVVASTGRAESIVVAVVPLSSPTNSDNTYVGGVRQVEVELSQLDTPVTFELLPSDHPSLHERVLYRVGWKSKHFGPETKHDIVMPDQDMDFEDLDDLGATLGDGPYLYQSDRLRLGGVAGLNDAGQVIDAFGTPVTGDEAAANVLAQLQEEIVNRQAADAENREYAEDQLATQVDSLLQTVASNLALAVSNLHDADLLETSTRIAAVNTLNTTIASLQTSINTQIAAINSSLTNHTSQLLNKADLVGGKLSVAQVPDIAIGKAISVANQAAMLALTTTQAQPGDMAVRPEGVWFLNATDPSVLGNWVRITQVVSVNGQTGAVTLDADSVGARSAADPVPVEDISGLEDTLDEKADVTVTNSLDARLDVIEADTTVVRLNGDGEIDSTLIDDGVAYVDGSDQIVKKDGTVIAVNGGGLITSVNGEVGVVVLDFEDVGARGIAVPILVSEVDGLTAILDGKVDDSDGRLADARTPTPHADSHDVGGSDPLFPVPQSYITDLVGDLASKASASTVTNYGVRISSLETRVTDLEAGGPGSGGGGSAKTVLFEGPTIVADIVDPSDFQDEGILLKSPWGKASDGEFYYDPAGAAEAEQVWPYITPNGHLEFREWDESNPADSPPATTADLDDAWDAIMLKADQAAFEDLELDVSNKADQSALDATNATLALKADQTDLDATDALVAQKANQSALDATNAQVLLRATQSDLNTLSGVVTGHTGTLANKANLVAGVVPLAELPDNIPQTKVDGLTASLAAKASLVGGAVPLAQIPTGIPQASVSGLTASLSAKADLVGGVVPTSQMPALATSEYYVVANRAAMLALSPSQVQRGDICTITDTADLGTYILSTNDPSQFANWKPITGAAGGVSSVNGQTGVVVLSATDVGARPASAAIAQSDVTGLTAALASKADGSATTTALNTKTTQADVQTLIGSSTTAKLAVSRATTAHIATLSGPQVVDGSAVTVGMRVLVKNQSSSIQNGIYLVTAFTPTPQPWLRVADMSSGSYFAAGSTVFVTSGTTNGNTVWQQTATSGLVDVVSNQWSKIGDSAPPYAPVQGNGINITGSTYSVVPTLGIQVSSSGVGIDTAVVPRKYVSNVPTGSANATINHNLGTEDVSVTIFDKLTNTIVLAGVTINTANQISIEFATAPTVAGQYRVIVVG